MKKNFGDIFSESLKEYGDKFVIFLKSFLILYLVPLIVFAIIIFAIMFAVAGPIPTGNVVSNVASSSLTGFSFFNSLGAGNAGTISLIVLAVVFLLIYVILTILLNISYVVIGFVKDKDVSFKTVFNMSRTYFWKYVGLSIVMMIVLAFLYLLLIIPGVIFTVYWLFAVFVLVREKTGVFDSLRRSQRIVRGRWWKTFGYFLLLSLIVVLVSIVTNFIPLVGALIPMLVLTPFTMLFLKNFYLELRKTA